MRHDRRKDGCWHGSRVADASLSGNLCGPTLLPDAANRVTIEADERFRAQTAPLVRDDAIGEITAFVEEPQAGPDRGHVASRIAASKVRSVAAIRSRGSSYPRAITQTNSQSAGSVIAASSARSRKSRAICDWISTTSAGARTRVLVSAVIFTARRPIPSRRSRSCPRSTRTFALRA
jgi:hypothetical protein